MLHISHHFERFHIAGLVVLVSIAVCIGSFDPARAQQRWQKTFASSEEACAALVDAAQQESQSALLEILGPTAKEIISSGDEIEDHNSRIQFVKKYREMHRLVREPKIYQKDLGQRTAIRARTITQYDPDATWQKVE